MGAIRKSIHQSKILNNFHKVFQTPICINVLSATMINLYLINVDVKYVYFFQQMAVCKIPTTTISTRTLHGSLLRTNITLPISTTINRSSYVTNTITSGTTTCTTGDHSSRTLAAMRATGVNWPFKYLWEDQFTSTVVSVCCMTRR